MRRIVSAYRDIIDFKKLVFARLADYRIVRLSKIYKTWEQVQLEKFFSLYNIDCVFDVGANYGQYALMLRRNVGYKGLVVSFEPMPDAASKLRDLSKNDDNWIIEECALSDACGEKTLNIMAHSEFTSLSTPSVNKPIMFEQEMKKVKSLLVKTETLTTAFNRLLDQYHFQKPFLKLDTQGYDIKIVTNGRDVVRNFVGIQSELAITKLYSDSVDYISALATYESNGFSLAAFVPNNEGHYPRMVETDCIMVNNKYV